MKILIAGASGLVGTHLTPLLQKQGHEPAYLVRTPGKKNIRTFSWSPDRGEIDGEAIEWADVIVNLSGAPVADKRWTGSRKKIIVSSRVDGLQLLADTIAKSAKKPKALISASAVGIYGMITSEKIFSETDPPATDFFGDCCRQWEAAADLSAASGLRIVKLRIGVVLARDGGALPKLSGPVRWFIGSPLGSGKQYVPWIHIEDLCGIFLKAIEDETMQGVYNAAGTEHATNKQLTKAIGKQLGRPVFLPAVPAFILKIILGEMAGIVTEGSRISADKIQQSRFQFKYSQLEKALQNLYSV